MKGNRRLILGLPAGLILAVLAPLASGVEETVSAADRLTFEEHIVPILQAHCFRCHGEQQREAGLDLRRRFAILAGGDSGPALVPGRPDDSLMIQVINDRTMPPDDELPLTMAEMGLLNRWVASGATTVTATELPLPKNPEDDLPFAAEAREHWAFQAITSPDIPAVRNPKRIAGVAFAIDAFVLAQLESKGWVPASPADKSTLIRRVYFDLIGLPPAPEDVARFVTDDRPEAWSELVDRLLDDPRYGERWAQHWLDVVRYAESEGFEYDRHLPDAWRYRDYVIDSLNSDKPFDQFVREQIAGDELKPGDPEFETATIFHRLGPVRRNAGNPDIALSRNEVLTERTNIIGEAFLGLTIGCARCHSHKREPISQKDYYRLQAYLASTQEHDICLDGEEAKQAWDKKTDLLKGQIKSLNQEIAAAKGETRAKLQEKMEELKRQLPAPLATIPGIRNDAAQRTAIHVLRRGVWEHKGIEVGPRPPEVLVSATLQELPADTERPRTQLADWLTSEENPLTARVIVNRIWQYHFGQGLVSTPNDFGINGARPSHPRLLDWLATTLVQNGWRMKPLHRLILMSRTYQQSMSVQPDAAAADPENRLLSHFSRRRLSGEEIRDAMLSVSGRLNRKSHGPSVITPVDDALTGLLYEPDQWTVTDDASEYDRRSIYLIAKRNLRLPFMEAFDSPTLQCSCPVRPASTHAPQALELLNGDFSNALAGTFAERLRRECENDPEKIVRRAWQLALGRNPTASEHAISIAFLQQHPLSEFTLAVFNLNEFCYVQ
ncbi:MAG: PSD1 domain-containing protein [Planctomycetaceae bacterium]|nr:PSD1 domain-containing protein [Planctomycetaceae bacterium]